MHFKMNWEAAKSKYKEWLRSFGRNYKAKIYESLKLSTD